MINLRFKIKRINGIRATVKFHRGFFGAIFGKKGKTDFFVTEKNGTTYSVSIISFITVHGRWNIEKARNNYYIEARRRNEWFYKHYVNSGDVPDHAREYKRETQFQRCLLYFPEQKADKHIFLVVPKPKTLTYAEIKFNYLDNGSVVNGYEIMFADKFFDIFKQR